jgi:hypothetical protein
LLTHMLPQPRCCNRVLVARRTSCAFPPHRRSRE